MPVRGEQRNVLELFIKSQSDFAVDPEPEERSGRVLVGEDLKARLKERKQTAPPPDDLKNGVIEMEPKVNESQSGLGNFLMFTNAETKQGQSHAEEHHLDMPPWVQGDYSMFRENHVQLHEEIVDWMRYMEPRPAERALRNRLINRLVDILQRGKDALFPEAKVHIFGSMRTGLLVPASDVDICVNGVTSCTPQAALERVSARVEVVGLSSEKPRYIQAKVPIIKFTDKLSKLDCDCSINAIGGRQNTEMVRQLLDRYPQSRPLILIIKTFLRQRKLNEVFSGGLSTYSISLMVIHMLQMFYSSDEHLMMKSCTSLGKLLIDFFHLYGFLLDYDHVALSVQGGGSYIPKDQFKPARDNYEIMRRKGQSTFRLAIEDPQNPDNDVSGGSREIHHIRTAFKQAFLMLTSPPRSPYLRECYADHPIVLQRPTLLNRILSIDRDLLIRRDALEAAYEKYLETEVEAGDEEVYCSDYEDIACSSEDRSRKRPISPHQPSQNNGRDFFAPNPAMGPAFKRRR